jgi:hypothetical protein
MSIRVKERLFKIELETTHEERKELDEIIENRFLRPCDEAIDDVSDNQLIALVNYIRKKKKKKKKEMEVVI